MEQQQSPEDAALAEALGREIAAARVRRRMTQRELAEQTGFSQSGLRNWELGVRSPSVAHLIVLARALGASPGEWLNAADQAAKERTRRNLGDAGATD